MLNWFESAPGRLYVVATLLPLAAFALLLVGGGVRAACRPFRRQGGFADSLYWVCGGDKPLKTGAYLATVFMALAAALGVTGLVWFLNDPSEGPLHAARWAERTDWVRIGADVPPPAEWAKQRAADPGSPAPPLALSLEVGYKIDQLTAVVFAMVTVVSTLIFVFSLGYMKDEAEETVEDHEVDKQAPLRCGFGHGPAAHGGAAPADGSPEDPAEAAHGPSSPGHFHRRGRFGRFFLYLSLFCFSMLNLVIADNLFQVFVSWELVGVCSFLLIGFYYERGSATTAANKAFIVNRIGDAGFLIGMAIVWTYFGTFNFQEIFQRVRSPQADAHGSLELGDQIVRVNAQGPPAKGVQTYVLPKMNEPPGSDVVLYPLKLPGHYHALGYGRLHEQQFTVPQADADEPQ